MKKLIKTFALITTGAALGRLIKKRNTYTISDLNDNLLVDIAGKQIISHESVKVYVNGNLT